MRLAAVHSSLLLLLLVLLASVLVATVSAQGHRGLTMEDFLLDDDVITTDDTAHVEGLIDVLKDPVTNFCPIKGFSLADEETVMRSKLVPNYKQDAAAAFFAANEYNPAGVDKQLQGYSLVKVFQVNKARVGLHANNVDKVLIVSAQGTSGDWISTNYQFELVTSTFGGGRVHRGFLDEVASIVNYNNKEFLTIIKGFLDRGYTVIFTGHSQGGAECLLYGQAVSQAYPSFVSKMRIVSVAAPRTGNYDFVKALTATGIDIVRYSANADPFTKVPTPFNCYQHAGEHRAVSCPYTSINSLFCHYPDIYFDDINNRQATPFPVKGISIADQYNYDKNYLNLILSRINK